ncbi:hypothetical protein TRVA0_007S00936 [Trichomonascus vanleenenianus]|uniref:uncharacterized protein n=1 Tax=Trichomonascus vanleenenianus TaxID=2268995 RepID=UPI003ECACFB3
MDEEAGVKPDRLYGVLTTGNAEDKLMAVSQLKREVKQQNIDLGYAIGYFEALELAVGSSDQALSATGFSCLCSLIKRITLQDASVLKGAAHIALPILVEKLGDDKASVRTSARKTFDGFWMACPEESEEALRERSLVHPNPTVRFESLQMLLSRVQLQSSKFAFRPFTPIVAQLLLDDDDRVQSAAAELLEFFFKSAKHVAKVDLQRTMHRQGVPKPLMTNILRAIGFDSSGGSTSALGHYPGTSRPSEEGSRSAPVKPFKEEPVRSALSITFVTSQDGYEMEDLKPTNISSGLEIRNVVEAAEPAFANPTEHNWADRERAYRRMRAFIRGNAATDFVEELQWTLKELAGGISKDIVSLRTTLVCQSCQLFRESAMVLGTQLDTLEPCLTSVVKMAKGTKKITGQLASLTFNTVVIHCAYSQRYLYHIQEALRDKAAQPKVYALQWLRVVVACHHHRQVLDSSLSLISALVRAALGDAHPSVREGARHAFWAMHAVWPREADSLLRSTDNNIQKGLESSRPDRESGEPHNGAPTVTTTTTAVPRSKSRTGVRPGENKDSLASRSRGINSAPVQSTSTTGTSSGTVAGIKREIGKTGRLGAPQRQPIRRPNNISASSRTSNAVAPPTPTAPTLMELLTSPMESERYARGIKVLSLLLTRSDIPSTIEIAHPVTMPRPDSISMIMRKLLNSARGAVSDVVNQLAKEELLPVLLQFVDTPLLISGLVKHIYPSSELADALNPLSGAINKEEAFETAATLFDGQKLESDIVKLALLSWLTTLAREIEHPSRIKNCLPSFAQCLDGDIEGDVYMQTLMLMQELSAYYELGPVIEEIISRYDGIKAESVSPTKQEPIAEEMAVDNAPRTPEPVNAEPVEAPKTPAMEVDSPKSLDPADVELPPSPVLAGEVEAPELTSQSPKLIPEHDKDEETLSNAVDVSMAEETHVDDVVRPASPVVKSPISPEAVEEAEDPEDSQVKMSDQPREGLPESEIENVASMAEDEMMDTSIGEERQDNKMKNEEDSSSEEEVSKSSEESVEEENSGSEPEDDQLMPPEPEDVILPNEAALMGSFVEKIQEMKSSTQEDTQVEAEPKADRVEEIEDDDSEVQVVDERTTNMEGDIAESGEDQAAPVAEQIEDSVMEEDQVAAVAEQIEDSVMEEDQVAAVAEEAEDSVMEEHPVAPVAEKVEDSIMEEHQVAPEAEEVEDSVMEEDECVKEASEPQEKGHEDSMEEDERASETADDPEQAQQEAVSTIRFVQPKESIESSTEAAPESNNGHLPLQEVNLNTADNVEERSIDQAEKVEEQPIDPAPVHEQDDQEANDGVSEDSNYTIEKPNDIVKEANDETANTVVAAKQESTAEDENKMDVDSPKRAIGLGVVDPPRTPARAIKDLHEQIESKLSIYEDKVRSIPHSPSMQASTPLATPTKRMAMRSMSASPGSPSLSWYSFESKKQYCMSPLPTKQNEAGALFESLISQLDDASIDAHGFRKLITIVRRAKDRKSNEVACELWRQERWQARLQSSLLNYLQQGGSGVISEAQLNQGLLQLKQLLYLHNETFMGHERAVLASLMTVAGSTTNKTVIFGALGETQDEVIRLSKYDRTSRQRVIESTLGFATHYPQLNREQKALCVSTISKVLRHVVMASEVDLYLNPIMELVLRSIGDNETYVRKESYPVLVGLRKVLDEQTFNTHVMDKLSTGQRHLMEYYWSKRTSTS